MNTKTEQEGGKGYWSMTEGVFNCLIDTKRTVAFEKAIRNTIKKGDTVVDMGTGSGVLAMIAIDAGADKVYAVEIDEKNTVNLAKTFSENNCSDKVEIIEGDITKIDLPQKVDVIVGEMIATGLIEELQIPAMNNMLRFAKEDTRVILNQFANYVDLVSNNEVFYGHSFPIIRYEYPEQMELTSRALSEKFLYKLVDFSKPVLETKIDINTKLKITHNGIINGLRISNETIFTDGSKLDASYAYSYPIILPIEKMEVEEGDVFSVKLSYIMCEGFNNLRYTVEKI